MHRFFFLILLLPVQFVFAQTTNKLHFKAVLVDTHNDVLSSGVLDGIDISNRVKEGHSDLVRWKEGGVDVQFFSVWTGFKARNKEGFFKDAIQEIDSLNSLIRRNPSKIMMATSWNNVRKGIRQKKLVALIGVEGGHMIEDDMGKLVELAKSGMRYMTLTWNNSTSWASSAMDETDPSKSPPSGETSQDTVRRKGLTEFGKEVVRMMNQLHVIIDLSHVGEQTFYDVIATTTKPVMLSHSSVWSICPVFRNVKDEQIKAVAKNGGVICINFYSGFISKKWDETQKYLNANGKAEFYNLDKGLDSVAMEKLWKQYYDGKLDAVRPTIAELADHIDHIVKLVGDDYAGIGSDYDGVSSLPIGLEDVTTYPKITEELKRRGYTDQSIKKILGGNVLRVMKANFE
ncbi:MAG: membrane dipeptidase [Chitinophagaceae bacterium]|nr:membrane dipeptidase [Chitinophagaceae bacterium]